MVGRTHLQDATPIRLRQVISGWVNAGGQHLDFTGLRSLDRPLAVNGLANAVNNAPFHFKTKLRDRKSVV